MLLKNVASQKIAVFAYTASTGAAKTGDAAQITAYISKDFAAGAATNDANPAEMDATNMPGWYVFDLTQAETNAEVIVLAPKSSTAGVVIDQAQVFTQDAAISSRASQTSVDDVPTVAEAGVPGYEVDVWYGLFVPRTTPNDMVSRLATDARRVLMDKANHERFIGLGVDPVGGTPTEFQNLLVSDTQKWGRVIKAAGIQAQ